MNPSEERARRGSQSTSVRIEGVSKSFGALQALKELSLHIRQGEFFTLLGPSGCGKTTLLRTIAGFEKPDCGRIRFGDSDVTFLPPWEKNIGFVFQNYALWPNMNVFQNIAYGLRIRRHSAGFVSEKVSWALELVDLPGIEDKYPEQLTGGEQQRIAVARALVIDPPLLLLDEPLSNLDAKLRVALRKQIREIQKELALTVVYVTHDQEEALEVSDRIAVMHRGAVLQVGDPETVYEEPADRFVADFVGKANFIRARLSPEGGLPANGELAIPPGAPSGGQQGERILMVRPEWMEVAAAGEPWHIGVRVTRSFYLGNIRRYETQTTESVGMLVETDRPLEVGESVRLRLRRYAPI